MPAEVVAAFGRVELDQQGFADGAGVGGVAEVDPFVDGGGGGAVDVLGDGDLAVGVRGDVDRGTAPTSSRRIARVSRSSAPAVRPDSAILREEPTA
ncbi:hypothetical protein ACFXB3_03295 [Streptomyces sp. NPDC059447]|uniref:hypothetical protein n=1 Tax=Streptomyces sp. NPDC059447 TaxID=3346834 RepID=UPI0036A5E87B